jgi:hypothetical protein
MGHWELVPGFFWSWSGSGTFNNRHSGRVGRNSLGPEEGHGTLAYSFSILINLAVVIIYEIARAETETSW